MRSRPAVVGVGNLLLSDEGVGVHAARQLAESESIDADVVDAGTALLDVLEDLGSRDLLVLLDAVETGGKAGEVASFEISAMASQPGEMLSLHDMGAVESLRVAALRGVTYDRVVVVGAQPGSLEWGEELSEPLGRAMERMVELTRELIAASESACGAPEVSKA